MRHSKMNAVCIEVTGLPLSELKLRTRKRPIANARKKLAIHLHQTTNYTHFTIADIVGWNGDHSMVTWVLTENRNKGAFREYGSADYPKAVQTEPCNFCNGQGWVVDAICCGNGVEECCGNAVPIQVQCHHCEATGIKPK
jgi:hypothetical protein